MKPFKFSSQGKVKHGAYHKPSGHFYEIKKNPDPPAPALLQGKPIGSIQEWRFALALMFYKLEFTYQLEVAGGRQRKGGQVLDFMVYSRPLYTPVSIIGEYWHSGQTAVDDQLRIYSLMKEYNGYVKRPLQIFDYELPDVDAAKQVVRREFITG